MHVYILGIINDDLLYEGSGLEGGVQSRSSTQRHTDNGSVQGCLASASWTAVLRLLDAACRTDVPCSRAFYSEEEREAKECVRKQPHLGPLKPTCIHE